LGKENRQETTADFSTALLTMGLRAASVEMTILLEWMEENRQPQQQPGSFDCVIRKCANDFAQDDKVGGWSSRWMRTGNGKKQQQISPLRCSR